MLCGSRAQATSGDVWLVGNTSAAIEGNFRVAASLLVAAGVFPLGWTVHQEAAARLPHNKCFPPDLNSAISGLIYFGTCCSTRGGTVH